MAPDVALNPKVMANYPFCRLSGRANVLIMPGLHSANISAKLLRELGLVPDFAETRLTPGAKKIVQTLLETDWTSGARLKLSAPQNDELRQFLHGFLWTWLRGR